MFSNYTYLYVEDDSSSREIMRMIMENAMGVSTLTIFDDSADYMNRLHQLPHKPDVILLDIHIKPYDGFVLLNSLRADPDFRYSKIIALTASVMNEEVARFRTEGFNGAIAKPLSVQTFPGLITRILNGESVWHIA